MMYCNGCLYLLQEHTRFGVRNQCGHRKVICTLKHTRDFKEPVKAPEWCMIRRE